MILIFYDREKELRILEERYKSGRSEFFIIYGRRRIGKTRLIKQFVEGKDHFYFLAKKRVQDVEIERFRLQFSRKFNVFIPEVKDWDSLFEHVLGNRKEKLVIIIDEFPFWIEKDSSVVSDFQHLWDELLQEKNVFLILCGSYVSVMENDVLGYKSPLYGRRTGQLELGKLGFPDFAKFFPHWELEDIIRAYGALDGIPFYVKEFDFEKSFLENVKTTFWKSGSVLNKEAEFLLSQELREVEVYLNILRSIFEGASKLNEIATKSHVEITNINKYIKVLINLRFVSTESPIIITRPKRKHFVYRITDNFFNFWLSYVYPFRDDIEIEETGSLLEFFKRDYDRYMGFVFELVCKEIIKSLDIQFKPEKIGRQWGNIPNATKDQNTYEIDLVGLNNQTKEILFCECKWQDGVNAEKILEELKEKAKFVDWNLGKRKEYYCVVAKSFSRKVNKKRPPEPWFWMFDLKDLEKAMK